MRDSYSAKEACLKGSLLGAFAAAAMGVACGAISYLAGSPPHVSEVSVAWGSLVGIFMTGGMTGDIPMEETSDRKFVFTAISGSVVTAGAIMAKVFL